MNEYQPGRRAICCYGLQSLTILETNARRTPICGDLGHTFGSRMRSATAKKCSNECSTYGALFRPPTINIDVSNKIPSCATAKQAFQSHRPWSHETNLVMGPRKLCQA